MPKSLLFDHSLTIMPVNVGALAAGSGQKIKYMASAQTGLMFTSSPFSITRHLWLGSFDSSVASGLSSILARLLDYSVGKQKKTKKLDPTGAHRAKRRHFGRRLTGSQQGSLAVAD